MIRLAFSTKTRGVHADRAGQFDGSGVEHPAIRRHQPGRADDIAVVQCLEHDRLRGPAPRSPAPRCHAGSERTRPPNRLRGTDNRPASKRWLRAHPARSWLCSAREMLRKRDARSEYAQVPPWSPPLRRLRGCPDCGRFLCDVDAHRTPGDAAAAADASRGAELVDTSSQACASSIAGSASFRFDARCRRECRRNPW